MRYLWEKTLSRSVENNIFLTWEKTAPSVNQLKDENSLRVLCATDENGVIGFAPFRKSQKSIRFFHYTTIEPVTNGNTDYTGIIIARQEKECLNQFLTYLFEQKDWDIFLLPNLPQGSQTLRLLKSASRNLPASQVGKRTWKS
jgi:hypothetical protein